MFDFFLFNFSTVSFLSFLRPKKKKGVITEDVRCVVVPCYETVPCQTTRRYRSSREWWRVLI